jgi:hypothetical protein
LKRAFALFLLSCGASSSATVVREPGPKRGASCPAAIEVLEAEVFVVKGWKQAALKIDGFDDWRPESDDEAREVLCRVEACKEAPPYFVKPHLHPFKFPTTVVAPLARGRFAVVPLGPTGVGQCIDGKGSSVITYTGCMSDDTIVLDEEISPLAFAEEGVCRDGQGPSEHVHRVIDPHTRRQIAVRTQEPIRITVSGRAVWIQGSGCDEMRNLDP